MLSNSRLKLFAEDPEEYHAVYVKKCRVQRPPTPSMQFGTNVEDWLFRGRLPGVVLLPQHLAGADGRRSDEFRALKMANLGKKFLTVEQATADEHLRPFFEISNNLEAHALADNLVYGSAAEINRAVQWLDPATGVLRMAQFDLLQREEFLADLKTARAIDRESWDRDAYDLKYHWQCATYVDAMYELTGRELPFFWIVVKNSPGYGVEVFQASDEQIETGRMEYRAELRRWCEAYRNDHWRTATFGSASQSRIPWYVANRGVEVKVKGQKVIVR